jgi:hypothetical protein
MWAMSQSLAELLLELVASLESGEPGEPIHEDDVVRILESTVYGVSRLNEDEKESLREAAARLARRYERDPARRAFFERAPHVFRL